MATTTNYGWTTPDDTALVKDGASAIRSLGTSVDTTTKNLNPSTTLGDIEYRSSTANTNTRLGIGSTGQVLTVAAGVPSWATPATSGGMTLLETVSLSGASTSTGTLSSSYKQFFVYFYQLLGTETSGFRLRLNGDTGSNYGFNAPEIEAAMAVERNVGTTSFRCGYVGTGSTSKQKSHMAFTITRPSDTDSVFLQGSGYLAVGGTSATWYAVAGVYDASAAITSMTFFPSGGTVTGTAYIYGVN
jgi:hypothetical protein